MVHECPQLALRKELEHKAIPVSDQFGQCAWCGLTAADCGNSTGTFRRHEQELKQVLLGHTSREQFVVIAYGSLSPELLQALDERGITVT
jgi:hypothetical protein